MTPRESTIQREIMLDLCSQPDIRVFRNNCGMGFVGTVISEDAIHVTLRNHRRIPFGLLDGSHDLIGWKTVTITPDMVGRRLAIFTSIETKSETGTIRPTQKLWLDAVVQAGGISGIARSREEARKICEIE
jgi:hypothetical protein